MNDNDKIKYGLKLKEYREKLKLSQLDVVNKANEILEDMSNYGNTSKICFTQNQLSNWERGKYIPHHMNRELLALIYGIHISEIDPHYPQNDVYEEIYSYIESLALEDDIYIRKNNMLFETEDEFKETCNRISEADEKVAFENGKKIKITPLLVLLHQKGWDITKKTQYLIDLHLQYGVYVPKCLQDILTEKDEDKRTSMYYIYFSNLYNSSLYASRKKK